MNFHFLQYQNLEQNQTHEELFLLPDVQKLDVNFPNIREDDWYEQLTEGEREEHRKKSRERYWEKKEKILLKYKI